MFISSSHKTIFKVVLAFSKMPCLNRPYILRVFTVFLCDCTNGENSEIDKHTTYIFRHLRVELVIFSRQKHQLVENDEFHKKYLTDTNGCGMIFLCVDSLSTSSSLVLDRGGKCLELFCHEKHYTFQGLKEDQWEP